MTKPLVNTEKLFGGYRNGVDALQDISITIEPGQLVGVLGPNGGGKTTLFRALLGELVNVRGKLEISDRPAYVPQSNHSRLDFPVSAFDVALMGAYPRTPWYRRVNHTDRQAARLALVRMGLGDSETKQFGALSGGQRQRVLIARVLVQEANLLLLDEPFSGVDAPSAQKIHQILTELKGEGRSVLMATHDINDVKDFDRVLCINGTQKAFGKPQDVLTPQILKETYGDELIIFDEGNAAVTIAHHDHQ